MYKGLYLVVPMLVTVSPVNANGADTERTNLVDSIATRISMQYEAELLDQRNHQDKVAHEAEARRAQESIDKAAVQLQAQRQQEEQKRKVEAEKQRTKPSCADVVVDGLIASSPSDVEALHAPQLSASRLEDILARHPYSCKINQFGVAYGCQGGAYISGRKAKIMNWTSSHYIIEIPLDFQRGRKNAPAIVRRSEARCV